MCGINGILRFDARPVAIGELSRMNSRMTHRGPDDEGFHTDGPAGLSMRRLSIIDIEGGHQPISNEDGRLWVVLNGEIYNYVELREELVARGHRFRTKSDTEVLVHLYEEMGEGCLERLNGMFAFAVWDARRRELFIANDRLGVKTLFYHNDGSSFGFSSELKSLLTLDFKKEIDRGSFLLYLYLLYVPHPRSIVKGVSKLEPATCLRISADGGFKKRTYWRLEDSRGARNYDAAGFREKFLSLLSDSIRLQMRSDVPVGTFLSGGIDSSVVVAMLARSIDGPVRTFSVGYEGNRTDERPFALKVARTFGTEHRELYLTTKMIKENFSRIPWYMDEPIGDSAAVPNFLLSEMAREAGVKVILNGTGGDEIFGGYTRYLNSGLRGRLRNKLSIIAKSSLAGPGSLAALRESMDPLIEYCSSMNGTLSSVNRFLKKDWTEVLSDELAAVFSGPFGSLNALPDAERYMGFDIGTYLPGDLLFLLDKMTMAASVEGRVPLLDHRLVEFMSSIPAGIRISGGVLKSLVKDALRGVLPDEILDREKMGFGGPVFYWMDGDVLDAGCITDEGSFSKESGIIDLEKTAGAVRGRGPGRHNPQFFYNLTVFEMWYKDVFREASAN